MSSFRPGDSAKLYASPESVMSSVGYRPTNQPQSGQTPMAHRSRSVPPPKNRASGGPDSAAATYKLQVIAGELFNLCAALLQICDMLKAKDNIFTFIFMCFIVLYFLL